MIGIIILCRYNSSRLPGKILRKIENKEILGYIYERLEPLVGDYPVVVATSDEISDDPIAVYCESNKIPCYRGNLNNVAERFLKCSRFYGFESAVRINGDNIFLDNSLIAEMITKYESSNLQFLSNVKARTFPKGISVEIVNIDYFEKQMVLFDEKDHEHVMTYFYNMEDQSLHDYIYNTDQSINFGNINLAIDTLDDFENTESIIKAMSRNHLNYNYKEIITLLGQLKKHKE